MPESGGQDLESAILPRQREVGRLIRNREDQLSLSLVRGSGEERRGGEEGTIGRTREKGISCGEGARRRQPTGSRFAQSACVSSDSRSQNARVSQSERETRGEASECERRRRREEGEREGAAAAAATGRRERQCASERARVRYITHMLVASGRTGNRHLAQEEQQELLLPLSRSCRPNTNNRSGYTRTPEQVANKCSH